MSSKDTKKYYVTLDLNFYPLYHSLAEAKANAETGALSYPDSDVIVAEVVGMMRRTTKVSLTPLNNSDIEIHG